MRMANGITPLATDYSGVREYIGARYVPVFANPVEWSATRGYEPLTIVTYQGDSYTSTQYVPTGIPIENETFWVKTGNYNAQVEAYRKEVERLSGNLDKEVQARIDGDTSLSGLITQVAGKHNALATRFNNLLTRYNYRYAKTVWLNGASGNPGDDDNVQIVVQNNLGVIRLNGAILTVPDDRTQWIDVVTFEQLGVDFTVGTTVYGAANADFESGMNATMRLKEPSTLPGVFNGLSVRMSGATPGQRLSVYGCLPVICSVSGLAPFDDDGTEGVLQLDETTAHIAIIG